METRRQLGEIPDNLEPVETLEQGLALFEHVGMPARDLAERTRHEYANDLADLAATLRPRGIAGLRQIDLQHLESYRAETDVFDDKNTPSEAPLRSTPEQAERVEGSTSVGSAPDLPYLALTKSQEGAHKTPNCPGRANGIARLFGCWIIARISHAHGVVCQSGQLLWIHSTESRTWQLLVQFGPTEAPSKRSPHRVL